jgi:acetyl-CoA carboxylase biotin carboxyl carrier protein
MTIDEIKQLVELVRNTGIGELEVHWGADSVKVRGAGSSNQNAVAPTVISVPIAAAAVPAAQTSVPSTLLPAIATPSAPVEDERNIVVKSPIVGTYYDAPAPGADVFVKIGDHVEPKQVLCIIESMKLMNEIEAETAGVIVAKHVENGRPVEYGESLFTIRHL